MSDPQAMTQNYLSNPKRLSKERKYGINLRTQACNTNLRLNLKMSQKLKVQRPHSKCPKSSSSLRTRIRQHKMHSLIKIRKTTWRKRLMLKTRIRKRMTKLAHQERKQRRENQGLNLLNQWNWERSLTVCSNLSVMLIARNGLKIFKKGKKLRTESRIWIWDCLKIK